MVRHTYLASGLAGLLLLAGCGLEAVDTTMRTRSELGVPEERALEVASTEFVCPHLVPINERAFNEKDLERGEVDGVFGPFVPCGAVIAEGASKCAKCDNPVKTPGASGDAPSAAHKMACPFCHEPVDPGAVQVRGKDPKNPQRLALNQCPRESCGRYFETLPGDVLTTMGIHEEVICPSCLKPVDPSLNACANAACKLNGRTIRNVSEMEGPCWRCGGQAVCPECNGSGAGTLALYGDTPNDCWACGTAGRCQECQGSGFTIYHGGLPGKFGTYKGQGDQAMPVESGQRGWEHPADEPAPSDAPTDEPPG